MANEFGESKRNSWVLSDIESRDKELSKTLSEIVERWLKEYEQKQVNLTKPTPTPEQAEQIRRLRELGLIP